MVPYGLWMLLHKSEHPMSTPHYFSLLLILSVTHMQIWCSHPMWELNEFPMCCFAKPDNWTICFGMWWIFWEKEVCLESKWFWHGFGNGLWVGYQKALEMVSEWDTVNEYFTLRMGYQMEWYCLWQFYLACWKVPWLKADGCISQKFDFLPARFDNRESMLGFWKDRN